MSESELLILARQPSKLTDAAQQILSGELSRRGLKVEPEEPVPPPPPEPEPEDAYQEDRELVELCTVWSLRDAYQLQSLLDRAGIPFYIGPENATGVEEGMLNFANGVSVKAMRIGLPWAAAAMKNYAPVDEPAEPRVAEPAELPVRCPSCHSVEVIFERLVPDPTDAGDTSLPQYAWTCGTCGYAWKDDGISRKA